MKSIKKILAVLFAASMMMTSFAACSNSDDKQASRVESVASNVKSDVGEAADNIGEGVTAAVSAVTSQADRMYDNGQVSDGDGIIGNEDNGTVDDTQGDTVTETVSEDTTDNTVIM